MARADWAVTRAMAAKSDPSFEEFLKSHTPDTASEKLDQLCQDKHLCEIACHITDWPALAPLMGITAPEMEEIRGNWVYSIGGQRIEFMRKWKEKRGRKGTYRRLCRAFWKAGKVDVAEKVCDVLQCTQDSSSESSSDECVEPPCKKAKFTTVPYQILESAKGESSLQHHPNPSPPNIHDSLRRIDSLKSLADYLRMTYESLTPSFIALQWPPPPTRLKAFNLALIQSEETVRRRPLDENLVMLMVTGKVDDIMKTKTSIKLKDLFRGQGTCKKRKVVLVEGAPGSGKSTMAYDICQKWEVQEFFHDKFKVVIYVQFRDLEVHAQSAQKIADLLPMELESHRGAAAAILKDCCGEGVLFILDGWDEYSPGLQEGSVFEKLICRPDQLSVQRSTVLITSRPIASGKLQKYATSRVEIVGFTTEEVGQYFEDVFSDTVKVQKLHKHLHERPLIKASCYLPLNAAIVAHLFMEQNYTLPTTLHGLFSSLVLSCIIRHMTKASGTEPDFASLDDLPPDVQGIFQKVCIIAYEGALRNKVIFSSQDLQSYGLPKDLNTLSLMQVVQSFAAGKPKSYHFLHLSIEELLAARHISNLQPPEQVQIFNKMFGQPRFDAVFRYYAAITKLQMEGIRDIVSHIVWSTRIGDKEKVHLLNLMHCLYEAQDMSLCRFVSSELKGSLDLSQSTFNPFDLLSLKYFLSCVNDSGAGPAGVSVPELNLSGCRLTPEDIDFLSLCNLVKLDLSYNRLSCASAANILTNNSQLKDLDLNKCDLTEGGVELFAAALREHQSLESLYLNHWCGSMHHVLQAILFHRSLQTLYTMFSPVDMNDVAAVLEVNRSLQGVKLGTTYACQKKHLNVITASDSVILARSLRKNRTLEKLTLLVAYSRDWMQEFVWSLRDCHLKILIIVSYGIQLYENELYQQTHRVNEIRRQKELPPLELNLVDQELK